MKDSKKKFVAAALLLAVFALWSWGVCNVDVQAIGPQDSTVGFAALNRWAHRLTGVHFALYALTDWLGLVPVGVCVGFGLLGLAQWVKRKRLARVDFDILVLGGFYLAVIAAYLLFEGLALNFRPVLIDGRLEASYPSSTTLLTLCVMPTAAMQFQSRIQNGLFRRWAVGIAAAFTVFMVVGRLISGVHWLSDIIGGILLSAGLVLLYDGASRLK